MSQSATNSVAYLVGKGKPLDIQDAAVPSAAEGELIVQNKALALNPVDAYIQSLGIIIQEYPAILGLDVAGVVVSVGPNVTNFRPGDRVMAMSESIFSPKHDKGGFQKYSCVRAIITSHLPDSLSFADASTFPLGSLTAAVGLFRKDYLALAYPEIPKRADTGKTVLIWGGASSVGANAIQLAVAAGYSVVSTASEKNLDAVRSLGARVVLDYHKSSVVADAVAALKGSDYAGALVAAAQGESFQHVISIAEAVDKSSQVIVAPFLPEGLKHEVKVAWIQIGTADFSEDTLKVLERLFGEYFPRGLETGAVKVFPPAKVVGRGLESLQLGIDALLKGASAEKLVVEL